MNSLAILISKQILGTTSKKFEPPVHFTSWRFSLHFVHGFRTDWNLLTEFDSSDLSFNKSILTLLSLKSETSAHTQIAVIYYYIFLQVSWHEMNLKLTLGYFLINEVDQ